MFTRSSSAEPRASAATGNRAAGDGGAARTPPLPLRPRPPTPEGGPRSVIGNDLKIIGQGLKIFSQGTLQVDGEIEGDVGGAEVIIGERGKVSGTVAAERVIVRGTISGVIRGATVTLQSSSHVEGDIHHVSLAIEQGAEFDGRCRRAADASQLTADLGS
jgi:cytoskeletal protein CcmA (bactofilin family)